MVTDRHYSMDIGTRYSMPPVSAVGRLPLATLEACDPGRRIDARLLTFRARAADQAHAAFTPGTTCGRAVRLPRHRASRSPACRLDVCRDYRVAEHHQASCLGSFPAGKRLQRADTVFVRW